MARRPGRDELGEGAGIPATGCVQPQTYSKFPRSCQSPSLSRARPEWEGVFVPVFNSGVSTSLTRRE